MKTFSAFSLMFLTFVSSSFAADVASLRALFEREFTSGYTEGQCGMNIDGIIRKAKAQRIDLSGVTLLNVDGGGELWVNYARGPRQPGSRAWFHHYIAILPVNPAAPSAERTLQATDLVLDFDFGNTPSLTPLKEYLERMFFSRRLWNNADAVKRDFMAGLTSFQGVDADRYLAALAETDRARAAELKRQAVVIPKLTLRNAYLNLL